MTTTTTGDPSSMKSTSSLSGGDLVSRLLAATPPYLYNVPLTPHSFFFSEMLRSFVQAKTDVTNSTTAATSSSSINRRRKRSWRESVRDRPLELTTKDKTHQSHEPTFHHQSQTDKYFNQNSTEDPFKSDNIETELKSQTFDDKSSNFLSTGVKTNVEESCSDFVKQSRNFYDDSSRLFGSEQGIHQETNSSSSINNQKIKPEDEMNSHVDRKYENEYSKITQEISSYIPEQKNKTDFPPRNFMSEFGTRSEELSVQSKNFLAPNPAEFLSTPLWYPPYPLPQPYPGIDPLHFFIDLRVSGHIWDRKMSERHLPFKNKHCSAFSVPQTKEFNNHPLNLTRDEASTSKKSTEENFRGTHFILKNLPRTYKDIREVEKNFRQEKAKEDHPREAESIDDSLKEDVSLSPSCQDDENGKDIRALIGLELVVDYVKEPKENLRQSPKPVQ